MADVPVMLDVIVVALMACVIAHRGDRTPWRSAAAIVAIVVSLIGPVAAAVAAAPHWTEVVAVPVMLVGFYGLVDVVGTVIPEPAGDDRGRGVSPGSSPGPPRGRGGDRLRRGDPRGAHAHGAGAD